MKLVYVSDRIYPSGNAGGVRIDYISQMFSFMYDVIVIAFNNESTGSYIKRANNEIRILVLPLDTKNFFKKFFYRYLYSGIKAYGLIKKLQINNSYILVYSTNILFVTLVLLATFHKKNTKIIFDIVENFGVNNFKFGILNPKYYLFRFLYNHVYNRCDGVFAISKRIQLDFSYRSIPAFILPPLFSSSDFINTKNYNLTLKNFIYSGNPFGKENIQLMFIVLTKLLEKGFNLHLHLTGVSTHDWNKRINFQKNYPLLYENTTIYSWMDILDLYKLYSTMHFTFFLREEIQSNICNFPMKLVEMMNYGIIPVISKVGDYGNDLIDNYDAFLLESNDIQSIIKKFEMIFSMNHNQLFDISNKSIASSLKYDYAKYYNTNSVNLSSFMNSIL